MHWLPYYIHSSDIVLPAFNRATSFHSNASYVRDLQTWLYPIIYDRFQIANRAIQFSKPCAIKHISSLWPNQSVANLRLYCMAAQFLQTKHFNFNRRNIEAWYELLDQTEVNFFNCSTYLGQIRSKSSHQAMYSMADVLDPVPYYVQYDSKSKLFSLLQTTNTQMYCDNLGSGGHARRFSFVQAQNNDRYRAYSQFTWHVSNKQLVIGAEEDVDYLTDAILGHEWTLFSKYVALNWSTEDKGIAILECLKNLYNTPKYFFMSLKLYDALSEILERPSSTLRAKIDVLLNLNLSSSIVWSILMDSIQNINIEPIEL